MAHDINHAAQCSGASRHFQPDIESFFHLEFRHDVGQLFAFCVDGACDLHLFRQLQTVIVDVRDHDITRSRVFCDCRRHDADRPRAGDEDIFSEEIEGERRMRRIAERVEAGEIIGRNIGIAVPDVRDGDAEIFRKCALTVDSDSACGVAEVTASGETVPAASADDVSLAADQFADLHVMHIASECGDVSDELMPDHHRRPDGFL